MADRIVSIRPHSASFRPISDHDARDGFGDQRPAAWPIPVAGTGDIPSILPTSSNVKPPRTGRFFARTNYFSPRPRIGLGAVIERVIFMTTPSN